MLAALGDKYDVLAELGLLAFPVQPILDRSRPLLQKILPVVDFTAFSALPPSLDQIYAPIAKVDDENLLLNMAFDVVLKTNSTCPPYFEPLNPDGRLAWRMQQSKFLMDWFSSRRDLYMVTCHGAPGKNKLPHFFLSKDVKPRKDGTGFWINGGGRACGLCGGHGCDYRQYRKTYLALFATRGRMGTEINSFN
ncbi:hypothetical protein B0H13DRAFT_2673444 [Mycena leptocephala]|nr:hypothetical protein B0H13DRAFT_2673444 [Mycena leptocephala]